MRALCEYTGNNVLQPKCDSKAALVAIATAKTCYCKYNLATLVANDDRHRKHESTSN